MCFGGSAFRGDGFGGWGFCTDVCLGWVFGGSFFLGSGLVCGVGGADVRGVLFAGVGFPGVTFGGSGLGVGLGVGFAVGIGVGRFLGCSPGFDTTAGRRGGSVVGDGGRLGVDLGIGVAVFVGSVFGTATLDGVDGDGSARGVFVPTGSSLDCGTRTGTCFGASGFAGVAVAATAVGGVTVRGDCDPAATDGDGGCGRVAPALRALAPGPFGGVVAVGAVAARG